MTDLDPRQRRLLVAAHALMRAIDNNQRNTATQIGDLSSAVRAYGTPRQLDRLLGAQRPSTKAERGKA